MPKPPSPSSIIVKGVVHEKIEALVNNDPAARARFLTELKNSQDDYVKLLVDNVGVTASEEQFLRTYWYNPNGGWWPGAPTNESKVRQNLIEALDLAVKCDLPIDTYHVIGGGNRFDAVVVSSPWQIIRLIVTPLIPAY